MTEEIGVAASFTIASSRIPQFPLNRLNACLRHITGTSKTIAR